MVSTRLIPFLTIQNGELVKTRKFAAPQYIGDPLNAVRIFNEKLADELVVLDISATTHERDPDFKLIASLSSQCKMPLCYGGGVKNIAQFEKIISLGVEKVAISSAAYRNPSLLKQCADRFGTQSVVFVCDAKLQSSSGELGCVTSNGMVDEALDVIETCKNAAAQGAGEIIVNFVDNDGEMAGYNRTAIEQIYSCVSTPITFVGGASCLDEIDRLSECLPHAGFGAGSLFVLKGKFRAVLISYPTEVERQQFRNLSLK